MPEEVVFVDKRELLSYEEIARFAEVAVGLGVDKIRLTGGEPLMRHGLPELVRMLTNIPGLHDLGLTTNGVLLANQAEALFAAGLRRLNVSLDTLDEGRFRELARRDGLDRVIAGLMSAKRVGFERIKINAVAMRGINDIDAIPLTRFCREYGFEMRFIEYMPIGAESWERAKVWPAADILATLTSEFGPLDQVPHVDPHSPSVDYIFRDGGGRVGIIASVSRPFCHSCNRLRLTAEGKLRNCLFSLDEVDIRPHLRECFNREKLEELIRRNVAEKWEGHEINTAQFIKPDRTMHAIGG
jgi:GTP 3',8-cyclase